MDRRGYAVRIKGFRKAWQSRCVKLELGKMVADVDPVTGETLYEKPRKHRRNAKPKAKMVYRGMLYHNLRRSCVRNLVRAGVPEKTAIQVSGHLSRQIFDRCNIASEKDVLEAGQKLPSYLEKVGNNSGTALHQNAAVDLSVQ